VKDARDGGDTDAKLAGPYAVKFVFRNPSDHPVGLDFGCVGDALRIERLSSGSLENVSPRLLCGTDCATGSPTGCPACAPNSVVAIAAGIYFVFTWSATTAERVVGNHGACIRRSPVALGDYQITVKVAEPRGDAGTSSSFRDVVTTFQLPANNDTVEIDLTTCGNPATVARWSDCQLAREKASCTRAGGSWSGDYCTCRTGQAECECSSSSQCLLGCMTADATSGDACATVRHGKCLGTASEMFGCHCAFDVAGAPATMECWAPLPL
jgi:hypothetical protein